MPQNVKITKAACLILKVQGIQIIQIVQTYINNQLKSKAN